MKKLLELLTDVVPYFVWVWRLDGYVLPQVRLSIHPLEFVIRQKNELACVLPWAFVDNVWAMDAK